MPILLNVFIETKEDGISITATDLEVGTKGFYPAKIIKPGSITLSAKKLYEVVKELPEKDVSFRLKENQWVEICSGKSFFNIMGISGETFPFFSRLMRRKGLSGSRRRSSGKWWTRPFSRSLPMNPGLT